MINNTNEIEPKEILLIKDLGLQIHTENAGDVLSSVLNIESEIGDPIIRDLAELYISPIRDFVRKAEIGWRLFANPIKTSHLLSDQEATQLIMIVTTLHELCYCVERLDEASFLSWERSTPVRFYVTSLYNYVSALFLLDKTGSIMGGTVHKVLDPLGLSYLLQPIQNILNTSMSDEITFGETIRLVRNRSFVHGTFSPFDIETVVKQTRIHDLRQQNRLVGLTWKLFNQCLLLRLNLISILTDANIDLEVLGSRLMTNAGKSNY